MLDGFMFHIFVLLKHISFASFKPIMDSYFSHPAGQNCYFPYAPNILLGNSFGFFFRIELFMFRLNENYLLLYCFVHLYKTNDPRFVILNFIAYN